MRLWKWFLLLSKRLYKKPSFLALLVMIPICVAAVGVAAGQDSGFVHIVLAQQQAEDGTGAKAIQSLLEEKGMILYTKADSPETAVEAVETGQADEAWIFPADIMEQMQTGREYVVQVITREERIATKLAREKIPAVLYEYSAKVYYLNYVRTELTQLDDLSEAALLDYYEKVSVSEDLFVYGNPADVQGGGNTTNYLTSPIRGLLGVLLVLCGMAATLYYMQDETRGMFSYVKESLRGLVALCCVLTAATNVSVVVLLALKVTDLAGSLLWEIPALLLYGVCCGSFCLLLRQLIPGIRGYCAVFPLVTVALIGLCPVFFDMRKLALLQHLLPPTYYVNALYNRNYMLYMVMYSAACLLLSWLLQMLKKAVKIK